jgi:leucyl aminopeptidase
VARERKGAKRGQAAGGGDELWGLRLEGWVGPARRRGPHGGKDAKDAKDGTKAAAVGRAIYIGMDAVSGPAMAGLAKEFHLAPWQVERLGRRRGEAVGWATAEGPLWILAAPAAPKLTKLHHGGQLDMSPYGVARDLGAAVAATLHDQALAGLKVELRGASDEEALGLVAGLETGFYRYRQVRPSQGRAGTVPPWLVLHGIEDDVVERGARLGIAMNVARHLVNLPPCDLDPQTFASAVERLLSAGSGATSVEVWRGDALEKERMGLLAAVGQAAAAGPALVHMRYRPRAAASGGKKGAKGAAAKAPLAFVGKGITFDSGGLDLKDAASMRLMKKDMGGAASLVGLAWWLDASGVETPCDFYLALAENAVSAEAFHPGDVITSRGGLTVEIDNTDAEGRLVLADALDVAATKEGGEAPAALIDLATLTGAMRVALGTRLAGMFSTDDALAASILSSAQKRGEPAWRMPLYADYMSNLKSTVADMANSGPGRFGGAITAALFLQRFVGQVPWAHFDVYCWTEGNMGGCQEAGGNGQCVQLLADFLSEWQG